jgi:hypothetical protein
MFSQSQQLRLLYLLTALLLLMQSFAIWHDAEHAFHAENEQCERFEAFGHAPTLDHTFTLPTLFTTPFSVVNVVQTDTFLANRQRDAYTIRAPPHLFS